MAARRKNFLIADILRDGRYHLADDLEVIPTPGHTRGEVSDLWSNAGRRFLFIGDTLVPIDGRWAFWVTRPNRPLMCQTIDMLKDCVRRDPIKFFRLHSRRLVRVNSRTPGSPVTFVATELRE